VSTVLVTGIAGFAGSHLAERLVADGHEVWGLNRPGVSLENIEAVRDQVHVLECDVTDADAVRRGIDEAHPDLVFHLAALAWTFQSGARPRENFDVNAAGTVNVLEALREEGSQARVLIPTTAEVYGGVRADTLPLTEETPLHPRSPYAISKVAVHFLIEYYASVFGMQVIEARPFNHIGPRQGLGFVVPDFAHQLAEIVLGKRAPEVHVGDLDVQRDLLDVRDVVEAYLALSKFGSPGEVYHICSGSPVSIRWVLDTLIEVSGIPVRVIVDPQKLRPHPVPVLYGSYEKLRRTCGWKPTRPLSGTLSDVFRYWLERAGKKRR